MSNTNEKKNVEQGEPWKTEGFANSFEEADKLRKSLKKEDKTGTFAFKVKRCGVGGNEFVVKSRFDPALKAELEALEASLFTKKKV